MKIKSLLCLVLVALLFSGLIWLSWACPPQQLTPLVVQFMGMPHLTKLSDGKYYMNYELNLSNATKSPITIETILIVDPASGDAKIHQLTKQEILENMYLPGAAKPSLTIAPGQSGYIRVNLSFSSLKQLPKALEHIINISVLKPLPSTAPRVVERVAKAQVSYRPVVIGPPVKGDKWIAISIGKDSYHRHAVMPVNGRWFAPERWAVDWVQLTDENKLYKGDPLKNESYPQYAEEIIAVSDGIIEIVRDDLPDMTPGKLPENMTLQDAGGNYIVQDIGNGYYAFYAHLKPKSIKVKKGEVVGKGQVIALLGNSGNTDAPHLHFHVIKGKIPLASDGVPYAIDSFVLKGLAISNDFLDTELKSGKSPKIIKPRNSGRRHNEMPQNLAVVRF